MYFARSSLIFAMEEALPPSSGSRSNAIKVPEYIKRISSSILEMGPEYFSKLSVEFYKIRSQKTFVFISFLSFIEVEIV
jgi:hypothetical protein